ncbi:MAG: acetamidase/formamidase family protein [Trueperaceae bacterium]|nr:acetamidase/formamidase family protein [Trueperaceae bacterium]
MAHHVFKPTVYHTTFAEHSVALSVAPGDTVETTTVDAAGRDATDEQITPRGNPMTGPFAVVGAEPGDAITVRVSKLEPNRRTGWASTRLAPNTLDPEFVAEFRDEEGAARVTWRIDREHGRVVLDGGVAGIEGYSLPLAPMLGCLGVAPQGHQAISTATSAEHGGNMDYRGIGAGVTMRFPVFAPGGLFFLGDGHAVQGAGEMAGTGVETSFDVAFEVGLIKYDGRDQVRWPRGEDEHDLFTLGNARPLDQAAQNATTEMTRWLMNGYGLSFEAASVIIGQAAEYKVGNMFDAAYTVVCLVPKAVLPGGR